MTDAPQPSWLPALRSHYPCAVSVPALVDQSKSLLGALGFTPENTLFANATCRDEVNAPAIQNFGALWGENFNLSGLAGYPTGGKTAFAAYHSHVPDDGSLFIVYGPHIGISESGELGRLHRRGMKAETICCGALISFLGKIKESRNYFVMRDPLDADMNTLEESLLPHASRVLESSDPLVAVTEVALEVIDQQFRRIIKSSTYTGRIALLGGIIINTPHPHDDWFAPRRADILNDPNHAADQPWLANLGGPRKV